MPRDDIDEGGLAAAVGPKHAHEAALNAAMEYPDRRRIDRCAREYLRQPAHGDIPGSSVARLSAAAGEPEGLSILPGGLPVSAWTLTMNFCTSTFSLRIVLSEAKSMNFCNLAMLPGVRSLIMVKPTRGMALAISAGVRVLPTR